MSSSSGMSQLREAQSARTAPEPHPSGARRRSRAAPEHRSDGARERLPEIGTHVKAESVQGDAQSCPARALHELGLTRRLSPSVSPELRTRAPHCPHPTTRRFPAAAALQSPLRCRLHERRAVDGVRVRLRRGQRGLRLRDVLDLGQWRDAVSPSETALGSGGDAPGAMAAEPPQHHPGRLLSFFYDSALEEDSINRRMPIRARHQTAGPKSESLHS